MTSALVADRSRPHGEGMTAYENLAGRTAVVTGASSGMGAAIATLFAASGARVALLARRRDRLEELAAKIDALAVPADVTDATAVAIAVDAVHAAYGPVDLLVNAAGVMLPNPIADGREDEWQRMIDLNLTSLLRVTRPFTPDLIAAAGAGRTADLVNVSSIGAHVIFPNYAVYGATKAAVTQLSAALGSELGAQNVRVTNLEPGLTDTELGEAIDNPALAEQLGQMSTAIGPLAADDIADLVGYITSRPGAVNLRQVVVLPTRQG
jgi:NADP-dependent 3-hydroxy acid dehydrogenase YdfG